MTGGGEAREVTVLQTLSSGRAGRPSLVLVWRLEPAGTTAAQHLVSQGQNVHLHVTPQNLYIGITLYLFSYYDDQQMLAIISFLGLHIFIID